MYVPGVTILHFIGEETKVWMVGTYFKVTGRKWQNQAQALQLLQQFSFQGVPRKFPAILSSASLTLVSFIPSLWFKAFTRKS